MVGSMLVDCLGQRLVGIATTVAAAQRLLATKEYFMFDAETCRNWAFAVTNRGFGQKL